MNKNELIGATIGDIFVVFLCMYALIEGLPNIIAGEEIFWNFVASAIGGFLMGLVLPELFNHINKLDGD